jgi:hypothetical protein
MVAFCEVCFAVRAARAAMGRRIESTEAMIVGICCLEIEDGLLAMVHCADKKFTAGFLARDTCISRRETTAKEI